MSRCVRAGARARECAIGVPGAGAGGARTGLGVYLARQGNWRPHGRAPLSVGEQDSGKPTWGRLLTPSIIAWAMSPFGEVSPVTVCEPGSICT